MRRNYPKTTGYYCYCHITPDEMFYIGMSKRQPYDRWSPSHYKKTSLQPYIEQYGWDNIIHVVLKDGLTDKQAEQLEDLLIQEATRQEFCINKNRSGGRERDNLKEYKCKYERNRYQNNAEYRERRREYRQRPEVKERRREYNREYHKTEKYKEYRRQYYLKKKQGI